MSGAEVVGETWELIFSFKLLRTFLPSTHWALLCSQQDWQNKLAPAQQFSTKDRLIAAALAETTVTLAQSSCLGRRQNFTLNNGGVGRVRDQWLCLPHSRTNS